MQLHLQMYPYIMITHMRMTHVYMRIYMHIYIQRRMHARAHYHTWQLQYSMGAAAAG